MLTRHPARSHRLHCAVQSHNYCGGSMSHRAAIAVTLIVLAFSQALRADTKPPAADNTPKLPFPKVEGWENTDIRPLPPESGGGYSVGYNSATPRIAVTIYVFN